MYESDISDKEWEQIEHYFDAADNRGGSRTKHSKRDIVNAIFYLNKAGVQWRMLPKEFPPWKTVYGHYSQWNRRGVWETMLDQINQMHRKKTVKTQRRAMGLSTHKV